MSINRIDYFTASKDFPITYKIINQNKHNLIPVSSYSQVTKSGINTMDAEAFPVLSLNKKIILNRSKFENNQRPMTQNQYETLANLEDQSAPQNSMLDQTTWQNPYNKNRPKYANKPRLYQNDDHSYSYRGQGASPNNKEKTTKPQTITIPTTDRNWLSRTLRAKIEELKISLKKQQHQRYRYAI